MALTRTLLRTEIQQTGFGSSSAEVTSQNSWLDMAYAYVWNAGDWTFKRVDQANLTVVGGTKTPTVPTDFATVDYITDNYGSQLVELDADEFDIEFAGPVQTGLPWAYKVVNRVVTLGPTPSASATFTWSYRRRVTHYATGAVITAGSFTADTDYPLWPDEHHYVLVFHAAMVGHALRSNPAAITFEGLRDNALQTMKEDLEQENAPGRQWGTVWGDS